MAIITFSEPYNLDDKSIKLIYGAVGVYFIYLETLRIPYPFEPSRLIYIGLSESKQNSIGRRINAHRTGQSGNYGVRNYALKHNVKFTFHSTEVLRYLGGHDLYEIENFFLSDFLRTKGAYPICNGQSGITPRSPAIVATNIEVKWENFS